MEYWVLYLCSIADSVHTLFCGLGVSFLFIIFSHIVWEFMKEEEDADNVFTIISKFKKWFIMGIVCLTLGVLTPETNKCYAIFGVGGILNYVNNSGEGKKIPNNAMKAVNYYLESLTPKDSIH